MAVVSFTMDAERSVQERQCNDCGRDYTLIKGFLYRAEVAHAIFFAALHLHDGPEAWIDVILGTFGTDTSDDHVTFGCRVGEVMGQEEPAATAVQAAIPYSDAAIWGHKLSREEALMHPRLADFWAVVDFLLLDDPLIHGHVYGPTG